MHSEDFVPHQCEFGDEVHACDGCTVSVPSPGAPWLRLVDGNFSCSGFVELHLRGRWGAVALSPDVWPELPTRICRALGCNNPSGIPIGVTVGDTVDIGGPVDGPVSLPSESRLPVRWEAVVPCTSPELLDCFSWTSPGHKKASTFLICPGECVTGTKDGWQWCPLHSHTKTKLHTFGNWKMYAASCLCHGIAKPLALASICSGFEAVLRGSGGLMR